MSRLPKFFKKRNRSTSKFNRIHRIACTEISIYIWIYSIVSCSADILNLSMVNISLLRRIYVGYTFCSSARSILFIFLHNWSLARGFRIEAQKLRIYATDKTASQKNGRKMKLNWNWWFLMMANLLVSIFITSCLCHEHISSIESKRVGKLNTFLAQWHVFNKSITRRMSDVCQWRPLVVTMICFLSMTIVLFGEFSSAFHYHHYSTIQRWKIPGAVMMKPSRCSRGKHGYISSTLRFCHIFCRWKYFMRSYKILCHLIKCKI